MDWWQRLKEKVGGGPSGGTAPRPQRKAHRVRASISALCSVGDAAAFNVEITRIGVGALNLQLPRPLAAGATVTLRIDTSDEREPISFLARCVWGRRARQGWEAAVRFVEARNEKRDRWVAGVFETYGVSMIDDRRATGPRSPLTLSLVCRGAAGDARGDVRNLSLGGLLARVTGARLSPGQPVQILLEPTAHSPAAELSARVVTARRDAASDSYLYGVAFDELEGDARERLSSILRSLTAAAVADDSVA